MSMPGSKVRYTLHGVFFSLLLLLFLLTPYNASVTVQSEKSQEYTPDTQEEPSNLFPLGIYGAGNSSDLWKCWIHGFNTVTLGFGEILDPSFNTEDMLFTCDVLGLNVLFGTSHFLRNNITEDLMDMVLNVAHHSSIYAWYIVDEPGNIEGPHIDEHLIREAVDDIRRIDSRPSFVQFSLEPINESTWELFDEVPDFVDIISVDPYSNMPYTNHSIVSNWVDTINRYNAGRARVWAVLKAFDTSNSVGDFGFDLPTEPEYMIDAILALQHGVDGILWFLFNDFTAQDYGAYRVPSSWDALGRVVRRIAQVAPIIVGRENNLQPVFVEDTLEVAYAMRGTQTVMLLTNHDYYWNGTKTIWRLNSLPLTIKAPGATAVSRIEPSGPVPIDFSKNGEFITFNITVDGGMILLIESMGSIVVPELSDLILLFSINLIVIVMLRGIHRRKDIGRKIDPFN